METVRLTTAQAVVRWLTAQRVEVEGEIRPLFAGVFAIFGHGNVVGLGEALEPVQDVLPTWRGQNEQGMALAALGFAKARRRRQIMVATSSIGPGAANMVTAAGVAHANRLPVLLLAGDNFAHRLPDPVLQQVEHFHDPTLAVSDVFKAVTRYWDRITRPSQILSSLPQALGTMLDPATCGPAFVGLPQDVQAEAYDFPSRFFEERVHRIRRPGPDPAEVDAAAAVLRDARRPLIVAGGGVHYSDANPELTALAETRGLPVVETVAGKGTLVWEHPNWAGPIGVTGSTSANALAADADVVLAVGTRLQDFTTGSWSVFRDPRLRIVTVNVAPFDARKHLAVPLVADARRALEALDAALGDWRAPKEWLERARRERAAWDAYVDEVSAPDDRIPPTYAQVVRVVNGFARPDDYVVAAAGGLPGELNAGWRVKGVGTFDCEYGFSCMGYEVSGAWGARMARTTGEVISLVGDGSWMMLPSDVYSTVLSGHKVIYVLCDNGGFAVINRLQVDVGGEEFNNLYASTRRVRDVRVDLVEHARSLGARAEAVSTLTELEGALERARQADRTSVVVVETDPYRWIEGGAWWEVGIPEVSDREEVRLARAELEAQRKHQRRGV